MIDVITNSSTELFIVDKNKVQEGMAEIFDLVINANDLDYETEIIPLKEYEYKDQYILPKGNIDNYYVIRASYHNELLNRIIEKFFNPIELEENEEDY
jgi:hypothetical protein